MIQPQYRIDNAASDWAGPRRFTRLTYFKLLTRYPIFLLFFGPPIFRSNQGIDATKGSLDLWSFFQVALLAAVAFRAVLRLAANQAIIIPKQTQSILRLAIFLGVLFLASAAYSPSHLVSAAYAILYLMTMICVLEFVVDIYRNPPDWMQCLLILRLSSLFLFGLVLLTLLVSPTSVMNVIPGVGIRLSGGAVAPVTVICPLMAIISAFAFLYSLESKALSVFLFLAGLAGTLVTQSRGSELALFFSLAIVVFVWAKTSKRSTYLFIAGLISAILLSAVLAGTVGGERIWNKFNRGEDAASIASASGRTEIWSFVFDYCGKHPQGMGYVAGFRVLFRQHFSLGSGIIVEKIGAAHNAFVDVLAGAGWLALAIYLIMLAKVVAFGWRFAKRRAIATPASDLISRQAIQCAMILLLFCFAEGMDDSEFSLPLRSAFY
ncbi:MAG: O-antigen ligase family protein, partial [Terracidiphilus sp.]